MLITMTMTMIKTWFLQFNRQLQADPNNPFASGHWLHPEQASGSEGESTSQNQRPLCLQELEAGACHHGEAEPPNHCLLTQDRLCRRLLLLAASPLPWSQSLRHLWKPGGLQAASWRGWANCTARASIIIHRNIKLENILLVFNGGGEVLITMRRMFVHTITKYKVCSNTKYNILLSR